MREMNIKGQSMFEVIFAIGIAAIVLIALVAVSTASLRNSTFSKDNARASKLAQECVEYLRELRDEDWALLPPTGNYSGGECNNQDYFDRWAQISKGGDSADVVVFVEWTDGTGTHQVRVDTKLTNWQTDI
jgi:Tfp pilus assembly protein PilV